MATDVQGKKPLSGAGVDRAVPSPVVRDRRLERRVDERPEKGQSRRGGETLGACTPGQRDREMTAHRVPTTTIFAALKPWSSNHRYAAMASSSAAGKGCSGASRYRATKTGSPECSEMRDAKPRCVLGEQQTYPLPCSRAPHRCHRRRPGHAPTRRASVGQRSRRDTPGPDDSPRRSFVRTNG